MLVLFPADSARSQSLRELLGSVGSTRAGVSTPPHPSVARVVVPERGGTSYGSGALVDVHGDYGLVITNWHVVADRIGDVTVVFPDGFQSAGKVLKVDKDWDLAAIGIWRPRVEPLRFSDRAPQIGEPLAIAGYGSGQWRMAMGRCTQYVSPGSQFPPDMIEVSVEARQGDSGGPIFNQQGEIAGVLFGAGRGATSGSHAPRVQMFLASVYPILREAPSDQIASNQGVASANTSSAAKPPVVAGADWSQPQGGAASRETMQVAAHTSAMQIEEPAVSAPPSAAPAGALVAAAPTPRRKTDQELRDWVDPPEEREERAEEVAETPSKSAAFSEPSSDLSPEPLRAARIERRQLDKNPAVRVGDLVPATGKSLVEPREQIDCAKFDPAFPSLTGGVEGEYFTLADAPGEETHIAAPASQVEPRSESLFEQAKSFLALLGGVTILLQVLRVFGGKSGG